MRLLFIGDIIGRPGRTVLVKSMPRLFEEYNPNLVVANGENAAAGFGITISIVGDLQKAGIDVITTGNHVWNRRETETWIDEEERVLRPANFPRTQPGKGWTVVQVNGSPVAVVNLQGRVTMPPSECPFLTMEKILADLPPVEAIVVDFHAEATSEKEAFARHFDGKVAAVIGTHTHVQTADEKILPGGTAFICDVGMTGGGAGVIGFKLENVLIRFLHGIPRRLEPEKKDPVVMGVFVEIENGLATSIKRFQLRP